MYAFIAEHDQGFSPPGAADEEPPAPDAAAVEALRTDWSVSSGTRGETVADPAVAALLETAT